ncbi:MAG: DUF2147 domain-containing protein [Pseudooceanicola sp.]
MRRMFAVFAAGAFWAGDALAADPVEGTWKTEVDDGYYSHIAISSCGAKICGTIAKVFDASGPVDSQQVGKRLLWDMEPQGGGDYRNGKIWRPSNDKVYRSKMKMSGNDLKVSGCIGPICLGQDWTRVK